MVRGAFLTPAIDEFARTQRKTQPGVRVADFQYRTGLRNSFSSQELQGPIGALRHREQWTKLTTIAICCSERTSKGKTSTEVRYFIGSRRMSARRYAQVLRNHWNIENNLHWHLDVTFGEDASTIHRRNAGTNFAALRRVALSLLKQNRSKQSIPLKRKAAALDPGFLAETLTGANKPAKV